MPISIRAGTNSQEISTGSTPMVETMGSLILLLIPHKHFHFGTITGKKSVDIPGRSAVVETPRTFHSMYRKMRPVIRFSWLVPPGPEQLRLFVSFLHYIGLAARLQSERLKCSSLD